MTPKITPPQNPAPIILPPKPKSTWKNLLLALIAANILIISIGIIFTVSSFNKIVVKPNKPKPVASATATPTPDPDRPFSILLLGYGGGNHDGGRLTDSIIAAQINPKKRSVNLVSIPRDLWVNFPIYEDRDFYSKINAAYPIGLDDRNYKNKKIEYTGKAGGGELAKKVVGDVVGFDVDYFVSLDFAGFAKAIDLLGGVDVKVERTFDDYQYPTEGKEQDLCGFSPETITAMEATMSGIKLEQAFTCRYEHLHFDKGIVHMDGATALKYVRSRHSAQDGGDYNRSARQRNLIIAVKEKILSVGFIPKIIPSIKLLTQHLSTDVDLSTMEKFVARFSESADYKINNTPLTESNVLKQGRSEGGQFILMPKDGIGEYDTIHKFIQDPTILTPTVTPSGTPSQSLTPSSFR